jgi:hemerythrin
MSNKFDWSDEYSVGIEEIDEQHKTLFLLINRLDQAILDRKGSTVCGGILDALVDYTHIHFSQEQTLMRVGCYPDYDAHCELHKDLVDEVEALRQKIATGKATISFELMHFLRNWLTKHILGEDMKYGVYFRENKQEQQQNVRKWTDQSRGALSEHKKKSPWWKFW